jgi:hypothetical protein
MAVSMGTIRNEHGGGHRRARRPELTGEMLGLAMDGCLRWSRWALTRLGYFARGRPETLIRDLVRTKETGSMRQSEMGTHG